MHGSHPAPYGSDERCERARTRPDPLEVALLVLPLLLVLLYFAAAQLP